MLDISSWRKSFYFAKNWGAMAPLAPPVAWALEYETNSIYIRDNVQEKAK